MPSQLTFRAQLVFLEQRRIYDYWCRKAGYKVMPCQNDIDAGNIADLAPSLSLLNVQGSFSDWAFFSAGSRSGLFYGTEIKGENLQDCLCEDKLDYWQAVYKGVVEGRKPRVGAVRAYEGEESGFVHFWLRLPLSEDGSIVSSVLCHDMAYPVARSRVAVAGRQFESQPVAL